MHSPSASSVTNLPFCTIRSAVSADGTGYREMKTNTGMIIILFFVVEINYTPFWFDKLFQ